MTDRTTPRRAYARSKTVRRTQEAQAKQIACHHPATKWYYAGYVAYEICRVCGAVLREEER